MTNTPVTLRFCSDCDAGAARADLTRAVRESALADRVTLKRQSCLNCCGAPLAIGLQGPGRASYVFDGVTAADAENLLELIRLYLATPDGWITDARPLGDLRTRLRTRLLPPDAD